MLKPRDLKTESPMSGSQSVNQRRIQLGLREAGGPDMNHQSLNVELKNQRAVVVGNGIDG